MDDGTTFEGAVMALLRIILVTKIPVSLYNHMFVRVEMFLSYLNKSRNITNVCVGSRE